LRSQQDRPAGARSPMAQRTAQRYREEAPTMQRRMQRRTPMAMAAGSVAQVTKA